MLDLVLSLFVVLGITAEHYFPYWMFLTGRRLPDPVRLIANYIAGTLVWLSAFTLWLVWNGYGRVALVGWLFAGLAGLTVVILYAYDNHVSTSHAADDRLKLLERRKKDAKGEGPR